jgi:Domain of unknown function (DUF4331)
MKGICRRTGGIRLGLMVVAATAFGWCITGITARATDARDAPTVSLYPALDINDLFMFRDPPGCTGGAGCNLVMAMTTQPLANPKWGATYHFQPNAMYRFSFSTTPDAIANGVRTVSIDFQFSAFGNGSACPAPGPACQTYRALFPDGTIIDGLTTQGTAPAVPMAPVITSQGAISIFAGPREEPAFFDQVGFDRFLTDFNGQTMPAIPHFNLFTGVDAFLGSNVNAIVVEFPISLLLPSGSSTLAAWAATYVIDPAQSAGAQTPLDHFPDARLRQIDRIGNPLTSAALIPSALSDAFNFGKPNADAEVFAPAMATNLLRYGADSGVMSIVATAASPDTLKFDATRPDGYLAVPPNGRRLEDRTTDFLISLFFNQLGTPGSSHPGGVTCPGIAQTPFSDCTAPKVYLSSFPFVGPPLQQTP